MVIKESSGREVDVLLADLASERQVTREGAIARLIVIGARAVQKLMALATDSTAPPSARVAAFRALEGIGEPRSLSTALDCLADADTTVAAAAVSVVGAFVQRERGVAALDRLTAVALETWSPTEVRLAAIRALADLGPPTATLVLAGLREDPDPAIAAVVAAALEPDHAGLEPLRCLQDAASGRLPDDPALLGRAIALVSAQVPPSTLEQTIGHIRVREGSERSPRRGEWMIVRAATHAALAGRGSRLALYDLRETIETAKEPLAVEFLAALTAIGDESCLEPIASAYGRVVAAGLAPDDWWRRSLLDAFRAIAKRESVTRRHTVAKRIEKRWPDLVEPLFQGAARAVTRGGAPKRHR